MEALLIIPLCVLAVAKILPQSSCAKKETAPHASASFNLIMFTVIALCFLPHLLQSSLCCPAAEFCFSVCPPVQYWACISPEPICYIGN